MIVPGSIVKIRDDWNNVIISRRSYDGFKRTYVDRRNYAGMQFLVIAVVSDEFVGTALVLSPAFGGLAWIRIEDLTCT